MIINPIAIATEGVYSNDRNIALATQGYADLSAEIESAIGLLTDLLMDL